MVARRLLILMLVMLAMASLASVFVADPCARTGTGGQATSQPAEERRAAREEARAANDGRLFKATLRASASSPRTIAMRTGDQLALRVEARSAGQVELVGLGQLEDVFPPAPARF